jgi:hypothetical protein
MREVTVRFMKIRRGALIILAGIITVSCSEKTRVDYEQNSQTKKPETGQEVTAPKEKRANELKVESFPTSAAESAEAKGENELQPPEDEIAEDCVAFLRSTKTAPAHGATADCPQCPTKTEATEVLRFNDIRVDRVVCSESSCEVHVTIHATFNPSAHESIVGGLTAWISPEQRAKYVQGEIPSGQQTYKVKVIYRRTGRSWRAVEFDRP